MDEESKIFALHKEHGNKWALIASKLDGRTDNGVKNQFYSTMRRCLRKINKCLKLKTVQQLYLSSEQMEKDLKFEVDFDYFYSIMGTG